MCFVLCFFCNVFLVEFQRYCIAAAAAAAVAVAEEEERGGRDIDVFCIVGGEDRQMIRPLRKQGTSNIIQVLIECFYILFPIYYLIDYTTSNAIARISWYITGI